MKFLDDITAAGAMAARLCLPVRAIEPAGKTVRTRNGGGDYVSDVFMNRKSSLPLLALRRIATRQETLMMFVGRITVTLAQKSKTVAQSSGV